MEKEIPIFHCEQEWKAFLERKTPQRIPGVWRGATNIGTCVSKWRDPRYLAEKIRDRPVKIHVSKEPNMDFKNKNFMYKDLNLKELILRASGLEKHSSYFIDSQELYYLRHIGDSPRGERVNFEEDFPELGEDFTFPTTFFPSNKLFSSILRISSPSVRIWTHYDVLDNFYVQIVGTKRAIFWAPHSALDLYLEGDKSAVVDVNNPDPELYPKFLSAQKYIVDLEPGDVLFIPSLWFHNMEALSFGVAVNIFWKNLDDKLYDKKDVYGNKDLVPAANADRMLINIIKQLELLPQDYRDFYGRQLINKIKKKCLTHEI
ncbi:tRNA wybutosine-synthesizing protein 5 [Lepeophtheirus salmonis]|uniref:JmjC domain-containing protein C2orf60 homolog n=2 Tax=Lepeophtheirus salmonis TaxID=72036 RepID=C1BT28_LEPSM|nr:tRNA wybutosine-synthesizing protein 5-like [Lepeophtheirus salmonis]ACO12181.1 JmjC domain-containing protein C2orf60 homolog [Lepeophtheirus salmonis]